MERLNQFLHKVRPAAVYLQHVSIEFYLIFRHPQELLYILTVSISDNKALEFEIILQQAYEQERAEKFFFSSIIVLFP